MAYLSNAVALTTTTPTPQVKTCVVTSQDLSSASSQACPSVSDKCVTATSAGMTLYTCSSLAAVTFQFDCANSGATISHLGQAFVVHCCEGDLWYDNASMSLDVYIYTHADLGRQIDRWIDGLMD